MVVTGENDIGIEFVEYIPECLHCHVVAVLARAEPGMMPIRKRAELATVGCQVSSQPLDLR